MVITGVTSIKTIQNNWLLKKSSVIGIETGSVPRIWINIMKVEPITSVTAAMMT